MDPMLQDVLADIARWSAANPNTNALNNDVATYENMVGNLPADIAQQVDTINAYVVSNPSTGQLPVTMKAGPTSVAPSLVSASGLRLGAILIPWVGVAAVALFSFLAWHVSKRHR